MRHLFRLNIRRLAAVTAPLALLACSYISAALLQGAAIAWPVHGSVVAAGSCPSGSAYSASSGTLSLSANCTLASVTLTGTAVLNMTNAVLTVNGNITLSNSSQLNISGAGGAGLTMPQTGPGTQTITLNNSALLSMNNAIMVTTGNTSFHRSLALTANNTSTFSSTNGSTLNTNQGSWLLANFNPSDSSTSTLTATNETNLPTEIYPAGAASITLSNSTAATIYLPWANGSTNISSPLTVPCISGGVYSLSFGGITGFPYSVTITSSNPNIAIESYPGGAAYIQGNNSCPGSNANIQVSYYIAGAGGPTSGSPLTGLPVAETYSTTGSEVWYGLQGRTLSFTNVVFDTLPWAIYVSDSNGACTNINNSKVLELGVYSFPSGHTYGGYTDGGTEGCVNFTNGILQYADLFVADCGASCSSYAPVATITGSDIWSEGIQTQAGGTINIANSVLHGNVVTVNGTSSSINITASRDAQNGTPTTVSSCNTNPPPQSFSPSGIPLCQPQTTLYASATAAFPGAGTINLNGSSVSAGIIFPGVALSISGTPQVGSVLTATGGGSYQWQHEGVNIAGATSSTYTVQSSDVGYLIGVTSGTLGSPLVGPAIATQAYYVDNVSGSDSNNGTSSATPWATMAKVNSFSFPSGTGPVSVQLKRGDTWRVNQPSSGTSTPQFRPSASGTSSNPIVLGAYGVGANPIIQPSVSLANTSNWTYLGGSFTGVWQSTVVFSPGTYGSNYNDSNDVGNLIWGCKPLGVTNVPAETLTCSTGAMTNYGNSTSNLTSLGQWLFYVGATSGSRTQYTVQVYTGGSTSAFNPANVFPGLEAALDKVAEYPNATSYWWIEGVTIQFAGGTCTEAFSANNIVYRDSTWQYCGGGSNNQGTSPTLRYGDCADLEGNSFSNILIDRVQCTQIYDGGFGPQAGSSGTVSQIILRNSVEWNVNSDITFITSGASEAFNGYYTYGNTIYGFNNSWAYTPVNQRTSPGNGNGGQAVFQGLPSTATVSNVQIIDNAITGMTADYLTVQMDSPQTFGLTAPTWSSTVWDYNAYWVQGNVIPSVNFPSQGPSNIITLTSWASTYHTAFEVHGVGVTSSVAPQYVNAAGGNFDLLAASALVGAGNSLPTAPYGSPAGASVWNFNRQPRSNPPNIGAF